LGWEASSDVEYALTRGRLTSSAEMLRFWALS